MNVRRVEITLSSVVWDRLERARGDVPRAAFIKRALESALRDTSGAQSGTPVVQPRGPVASSAPSSTPVRAPVVDVDEFAAGEVMDPDPVPVARASEKLDRAAQLMWERQQRLNKGKK